MSTDFTSSSDEEKVVEALYWWGIPTLFRCPHEPDPTHCDIALVGVPHSSGNGTTERDQHLGPRAVRDVSAYARRVHNAFNFSPWDTCKIADLGDVCLPEAMDNEKCIDRIAAYYKKLDDCGVNPVSIGGDHSVTGGIVQSIAGANARLTEGKKASFLHFDAHTDTFHNLKHFMGAKRSAAHWGSYLVHDGHIDAHKSIQVGIRGHTRSLDWLKPSYELGYDVLTKEEYDIIGQKESIARVHSRLDGQPIYITFDLDSLDPTVAPGVSNLEPGCDGFKMNEAIAILRSLKGQNVIGGDVVCLMPTKDSPNKITAQVAAYIMFEILSLVAWNKQSK